VTDTWVIGDVHGCADELERLVRAIDALGPARLALVGDLYTKGPDPVGVWRQIAARNMTAVQGNHDVRLLRAMAGKRPKDRHAADVAARLDSADPAWRAHLAALPYYVEVEGWTVVHASIHPSGDLDRTTPRDFVARRRVPKDRATDPFWWSVYRGERRVVFGHDAARGLVQVHRHGALLLAGLDTGCVYGGRLTALRLRDGHVLQVPAARPYVPIQR